MWIIKSMENKYLMSSLDLVEDVFVKWDSKEEGKIVRQLVEEIRSKKYYVPELELVMVDEEDMVIGYAMFSRFYIEGKYEDELLILTPVAVKTEFQRQHISKELLEYGFEKAKDMGIKAGSNIKLPHRDCLMVKELVEGTLDNMSGFVDYSFYEALHEG